jgi:hypothetical protein
MERLSTDLDYFIQKLGAVERGMREIAARTGEPFDIEVFNRRTARLRCRIRLVRQASRLQNRLLDG